MATKFSFFMVFATLIVWLVVRQPIGDFILVAASTFTTVSLVVSSMLKKNRRLFLTMAAPWLMLASYFQIAAYTARVEAGKVLEELPTIANQCKGNACIAMKATGVPYSVAGTQGFLIESLGASIYVKLFSDTNDCRAHEDELLGRARVAQWRCNVDAKE